MFTSYNFTKTLLSNLNTIMFIPSQQLILEYVLSKYNINFIIYISSSFFFQNKKRNNLFNSPVVKHKLFKFTERHELIY